MTQSSFSRDANLVAAFAVAVVDRMAGAIEGRGVSFGSGAAAVVLIHQGHIGRIDDLREPLGLTQAGAVRLVDRLERHGLARRVARSGDDLRLVRVELTHAGSETAARVLAAREQATASFLGSLSSNQTDQLARACEAALASAATAAAAPARLCRYCDEEACDLTRCPVEIASAGVA
jgi:DNA-binding MarR family transcriptional regulator